MKNASLIFAIVILLTLGLFLVSCSDSNDADDLEKFEQLLEELESEPDAAEPFAEKLYLIIPQDASAELSAKARELALAISEKTKVEAMVKYDNENAVIYSNDLLMLLGSTDNIISQEAVRSLKYGEYICKWDREVIVLGGRHDTDTVAAINAFTERILPGASNASLMSEGAHFENSVEYRVSSVALNGYDLYDFTFVCSADTQEKTEILRNYIAQESGYLLDIAEDAGEVSGKTISISLDAEGADAVIEPDENDLSLCGSDSYGLSVAIAEFAELLFENISDGAADAQITRRVAKASAMGDISVCTSYVLHNENADIGWIDDMVDNIQNGGYHIFTFAGVTEETSEYIEMNLPDGYTYQPVSAENGDIYPVIYKKSAFEGVSCELSGNVLVINMKAKGESEGRRVIRAFGGGEKELDKLTSLLREPGVYDTIIFDGHVSADITQSLALDYVASETWEYEGTEYSHALFIESALCAETVEDKKTEGSGYVNFYLSASVSAEYCEKFELLNNAVE